MNVWLFVIPFTIAAALPGPAQGALVARVLSRGSAATVPFIAGMVFGNACWLLVAVFGLSTLALRFAPAFVLIKWIGVAYLLYIAWRLWSANAPKTEHAPERPGGGFVPGALLTLGNPKAVVFFGSVLPQAFDMTALTFPQVGTILVLGISIDLAMQLLYLVLAGRVRNAIASPRHMKVVNRSAAGLIAGCAAVIATRA